VAGEVQAAAYKRLSGILEEGGINLVLMNTANHDQAAEYLKRYESVEPFPGHLFLDPSKTTHRHFGLFYGVYRSLIPPILLGVPKYGLR